MKPLKAVLTAFRQELEAAFPHSDDGLALRPQRVVLALQVSLVDHDGSGGSVALGFAVLENSEINEAHRANSHTATFEFNCAWAQERTEPSAILASRSVPTVHVTKLEGAAAESVQQDLQEVFGAPGFDSSARATVFLEALAELSDGQIMSVMDTLRGEKSGPLDEPSRKARHFISNVIRSGPLKSVEAAGSLLASIFARHPAEQLRQLIATTWRSQYEWPAGRGG